MREFQERRDIENFYEQAKKQIKEKIETKNISMKGSTKGIALAEIISILDQELEIDIAEELVKARKALRAYYKKYYEVEDLDRKFKENDKKLKEQQKLIDTISLISDETLKNALLVYNSIPNKNDARDIVIAYLKSKENDDLIDVIDESK